MSKPSQPLHSLIGSWAAAMVLLPLPVCGLSCLARTRVILSAGGPVAPIPIKRFQRMQEALDEGRLEDCLAEARVVLGPIRGDRHHSWQTIMRAGLFAAEATYRESLPGLAAKAEPFRPAGTSIDWEDVEAYRARVWRGIGGAREREFGRFRSEDAAMVPGFLRSLPMPRLLAWCRVSMILRGPLPGDFEPCLLEMARRGRKESESHLTRMLHEAMDPACVELRDSFEQVHPNLEILTALRRVQGRRDPLAVVPTSKGPFVSEFPDLPSLPVAFTNVDTEKLEIGITNGGDYRGGRQARWKLALADKDGTPVGSPVLDFGTGMGGGMYTRVNLAPGDAWETTLRMSSYVRIDAPGEYLVRVLYHDRRRISGLDDLAGLIVASSEPIRVSVRKKTVRLTRVERASVLRDVRELDESKPVRILAAAYEGKMVHEFVPPDSAQGRIHTLGWKAVPPLVTALSSSGTSARRRAWILGLLFSITGHNDPRGTRGVLHGYESMDGTRPVWGRMRGGPGGGLLAGRGKSSGTGKIIEAVQREFIERWAAWAKHIDVVETAGGAF